MTEPWGALRIDVVDDDIIVSLPGTTYSVTYFKRPNSPQLLAKRISDKDDLPTPVTLSEFLSRAWRGANDKAASRSPGTGNRGFAKERALLGQTIVGDTGAGHVTLTMRKWCKLFQRPWLALGAYAVHQR
jgi:hypothetical protein